MKKNYPSNKKVVAKAQYSTSMDERETIDYLLADHDMGFGP